MPMHDWTRVDAGTFHHFQLTWACRITDALSRGAMPKGMMALLEPVCGLPIPHHVPRRNRSDLPQPTARVVQTLGPSLYARRKDRIVVRHRLGPVVAIIDLVSPGDKGGHNALRSFVERACDALNQGIHLVVVDLFPPTPRDPQGLHKAIWDQFEDVPFASLPGKPLTVASYVGGDSPTAYVETVGVGDELPSIPLFLTDDEDYVLCPLEATYLEAWAAFPAVLKELVETPAT